MSYITKVKKSNLLGGKGYLVTVTDPTGIKPTEDAYLEESTGQSIEYGCGNGWRTFFNLEGEWECHEGPVATKKEAIYWLQHDGC